MRQSSSKGLKQKLDAHLTDTQFGFRKGRSTSDAIHILRRVIEMTEAAGINLSVISLDWTDAFDKLEHKTLFHSLESLGIRGQVLNCVTSLYESSEFFVEMDGTKSENLKQTRGIRQGCPLSPYLFLATMTCLFEDVYTECRDDEVKIVEKRSTRSNSCMVTKSKRST